MAIEKLKSGKYRVRVNDKSLDRRVPVGTFPTLAGAKAAERHAETEMVSVGIVSKRKDTTLGALCEGFLAASSGFALTTRKWYASGLMPAKAYFGEGASVRRISRDDVQRYAAHLVKKGLAANSVRGYVKTFSTMMNYAIECEYRETNPCLKLRGLPPQKRAIDSVRAITRSEHGRLAECVQTVFRHGRGSRVFRGYQVMVAVMPYIGLRRSEVQGLTWECVDLDAMTVRVEYQLLASGLLTSTLKTPKARRTVVMPEETVALLRKWQVECPPNPLHLVFPTPSGKSQTQAQFYRIWGKATVAAELQGLDPHDLRHSFATWHLAAGVNIRAVADEMGHEKPSITLDTYSHLLGDAAGEAARAMRQWYSHNPVAKISAHTTPTQAFAMV